MARIKLSGWGPHDIERVEPGSLDEFPSVGDNVGPFREPPYPFLIEGVLRKGGKMMITGASKTGKSWFAIDLAWSIVTGAKLLDRFRCERGRVVYVNAELDEREFWERVERVADMREIPLALENYAPFRTFHTRGQGMDMGMVADRLIKGFSGIDVAAVIIDPIYKYESGNENDLETVRILAEAMDRIADALGCSVIYVHHHAKGQAGARDMRDRGAGSGGFSRDYDAHIDLTELHAEKGSAEAQYIEGKYGKGARGLQVDFEVRSSLNPGPMPVVWKWPLFIPVDDETVASLPLIGSTRANSRKGGESTKRANDSRKHRENLRMGRAIEQCKASGEKHDRRGVFPIYRELAEKDGEDAPGYETFKSWTQPGGRLAYRVDRENGNVLVPKRADQD